MADVRELTDQDFEAEVLQATEPVLVDFRAPCHRRRSSPDRRGTGQGKQRIVKGGQNQYRPESRNGNQLRRQRHPHTNPFQERRGRRAARRRPAQEPACRRRLIRRRASAASHFPAEPVPFLRSRRSLVRVRVGASRAARGRRGCRFLMRHSPLRSRADALDSFDKVGVLPFSSQATPRRPFPCRRAFSTTMPQVV